MSLLHCGSSKPPTRSDRRRFGNGRYGPGTQRADIDSTEEKPQRKTRCFRCSVVELNGAHGCPIQPGRLNFGAKQEAACQWGQASSRRDDAASAEANEGRHGWQFTCILCVAGSSSHPAVLDAARLPSTGSGRVALERREDARRPSVSRPLEVPFRSAAVKIEGGDYRNEQLGMSAPMGKK